MTLSAAIRKALKIKVYYYFEASNQKWAVDFMCIMPKNDFVSAEEFDAVKYFSTESGAIKKAESLAEKLSGIYEGRILDMED